MKKMNRCLSAVLHLTPISFLAHEDSPPESYN